MMQYSSVPAELEEHLAAHHGRIQRIVDSFVGPFDAEDVIIAYFQRHGKKLRRHTAHQHLALLAAAKELKRLSRGVYQAMEELESA